MSPRGRPKGEFRKAQPEATPVSRRTRIKICGLTREADVDAAVAAGADAIGLVLYAKSPRAVSAARAGELASRLPAFVTPVLLFVNASATELAQGLAAVPQALLQFHGDESPEACQRGAAQGRPYMRAARMTPELALLDFALAHRGAAGLVLDAHVEGYGGGGKAFDWSLVPHDLPCPVVLSGGLNPANVGDGITRLRPWAVDVSSGVESGKGLKDAQLMRQFCAAVRAADARLAEQNG